MDAVEERLRNLRHLIVRFIKDAALFTYLKAADIIYPGECTTIEQLYQTDPSKATEELIEALLTSQKPGKWQTVIDSLKGAGFPFVIKLLDPIKEHHVADTGNKVVEELRDEPVVLRLYQEELVAPALQGNNCMIVSPPNAGKTIIAMKVMQEHLQSASKRTKPKVIYLVNQVNLANQQLGKCNKYLGKYGPKLFTGDILNSGQRLKDYLQICDVFVVTAQVLLNALRNKDVESITEFSLIVFDECHHAHGSHTFNNIMGFYMDLWINGSTKKADLPQILGLTASPGVDKAGSVESAMTHIKTIMANLDTPVLCTVQEHKDELQKFVGKPTIEFHIAPRRASDSDKFRQSICKQMEEIEDHVLRYRGPFQLSVALPEFCSRKGSEQYIPWLYKFQKYIDDVTDGDVRRYLFTCHDHLEAYNKALLIYEDARIDDAVSYLEKAVEVKFLADNTISVQKELLDRMRKVISTRFEGEFTNAKLEKLKEIVLSELQCGDYRGIVFVKRRTLAGYLSSWMKCTQGLAELNPEELVGQGNTADRGGMTRTVQFDVLANFRDGRHKVLVATSIAEEGLDIAECKFVVRYDHVTNEISTVQTQGRSRSKCSKYYIVTSEVSGTADKERLNIEREKMMYQAIKKISDHHSANPDGFADELEKLQKRDIRAKERKNTNRLAGLADIENFRISCRKCGSFLCDASYVRKVKENHRVVIDSRFSERVEFQEGTVKNVTEIELFGKTLCKKCKCQLGTRCRYLGDVYPVLKVTNLHFCDKSNTKGTPFKKWREVPFDIEPL